jgi:hypothetical protein
MRQREMRLNKIKQAKERSVRSVTGEQPEHVDGNFSCHDNQLTSLEGAPKSVDGDFF